VAGLVVLAVVAEVLLVVAVVLEIPHQQTQAKETMVVACRPVAQMVAVEVAVLAQLGVMLALLQVMQEATVV
jgi:hypothetical protein